MALPTIDEFLGSLYDIKRGCVVEIEAAEARGDLKEARLLHKQLAKVNLMIQQKGGDLDA